MTSMTLTYFNDLPQWLSYDLLPYHMIALYPIVYIQLWLSRSSHRKCSIKNVFLEISQNSQENTCTRSFPVNFAKFLITPFYEMLPGDWFCLSHFQYFVTKFYDFIQKS